MIYLLSDPPKKSIGVMTWLPLDGGGPNPMTRQPPPAWQIYTQLKEGFDVKKIPTDASEIPADIQVLLVVHPKNISEKAQYAIDQFVLKGGARHRLRRSAVHGGRPPGRPAHAGDAAPEGFQAPQAL